jgi:uncharacterized protein YkwD
MKIQILLLLLALSLALRIAEEEEETEFEDEDIEAVDPLATAIFDAHNFARQNPGKISEILQGELKYFEGNTLWLPGKKGKITKEGPAVWKEAIAFLATQKAVPPLKWDDKLMKAAEDHVKDLAKNSMTGHIGSDKSTPFSRINKYGAPDKVASENIACGATAGIDVVTQLIVDDDVPTRAHRLTLYSTGIVYAGAFCGPHPLFRICCVIDYVDGWYVDS